MEEVSRQDRLISFAADAFRGHGFSLLVTMFLRGLQLVLFPLKSPPPIQSTESVSLQHSKLRKWSAMKTPAEKTEQARPRRQCPGGLHFVRGKRKKEIADHIFYRVQKLNPRIFILLY